jgi:hypothetical protein
VSRTAASLLREALEQVGVRYTFGIPGVHNTEIYDELSKSNSITPVLVDYSKRTRFTEGIVKTNLERFDLGTKARLVGRVLWRRLSG